MLSKTQMVRVRKTLDSSYNGKCQVTNRHKIKKSNGATAFEDVVVITDQPCRLSYKTISGANNGETMSGISQIIKLFLAPDVEILAGSKITVTQHGVTADYKASGQPAIYASHQEIILELYEENA